MTLRLPGTWTQATILLALVCCARVPARAAESTPTYSLNWVRHRGAEGCASSQLLARAIEQLLGPVLRTPGEAELAIEGAIAQAESGVFEMELRVLTPEGEVKGARSLRRAAAACSELTPAVLLVLTLTLDPEGAAHGFPTEVLARLADVQDPERSLLAELERAETKRSAPATPPPAPRQAAAPPLAEPPLSPASPTLRGALQLGPAFAFGLLPNVAWGAHLAAELSPARSWGLAFGLDYWAPSSVDIVAFGVRKRVDFSAAQAQLSLCIPTLPSPVWQLSACAGGALGLRWADASALAHDEGARRLYGGPLLKLALSYAIDARWFASLDVSGALLWRRDRFTYRDAAGDTQPLFRPELASLWSSLNVGVHL